MKHQYKTVVIVISLDPKTHQQVLSLGRSPLLENAKDIHLVHVHNRGMTHQYANYCPDMNDLSDLEGAILKKLELIGNEFGKNPEISKKIHTHCFFNANVKLKALEYIREIKADLVIAATRGEYGPSSIFAGSFSIFLVEHAPCDVHILRPDVEMPLRQIG